MRYSVNVLLVMFLSILAPVEAGLASKPASAASAASTRQPALLTVGNCTVAAVDERLETQSLEVRAGCDSLAEIAPASSAAFDDPATTPAESTAPTAWVFPAPVRALPLAVPAPVRQFEQEIFQAADEHGLDPLTLAALMYVESKGNPNARSSAGAIGLMQVMPGWFGPGENPWDPMTNIRRGAWIFRQALDELGDESLALAAYLGGTHNVRGPAVPAFARHYVAAVFAERERFQAAPAGTLPASAPGGDSTTLDE